MRICRFVGKQEPAYILHYLQGPERSLLVFPLDLKRHPQPKHSSGYPIPGYNRNHPCVSWTNWLAANTNLGCWGLLTLALSLQTSALQRACQSSGKSRCIVGVQSYIATVRCLPNSRHAFDQKPNTLTTSALNSRISPS